MHFAIIGFLYWPIWIAFVAADRSGLGIIVATATVLILWTLASRISEGDWFWWLRVLTGRE